MYEIDSAIAEAREASAQIRDDIREMKEASKSDGSEVEKARRAGEHGSAWQRIQMRIDTNQTTLADVFNGIDRSSEAEEIRKTAAKMIGPARSQYMASMDDASVSDAMAEAKEAQRELAVSIGRLRSMGY